MPKKISFCTSCMNRTYQLKETLPKNLSDTAGNPNVEFTLSNYNSADELDDWIKDNFMEEIKSGRLIYGHERTAQLFHMSKAKNLAHRLATGDILMSLDADNFVLDSAGLLAGVFEESPDTILHMWSGVWHDGSHGRVASTRQWFEKLGGYDEALAAYCYEDRDFMYRGQAMGMTFKHVSQQNASLFNTKAETAMYTGLDEPRTVTDKRNRLQSQDNIKRGLLVANPSGWGCGVVEVNFDYTLTFGL